MNFRTNPPIVQPFKPTASIRRPIAELRGCETRCRMKEATEAASSCAAYATPPSYLVSRTGRPVLRKVRIPRSPRRERTSWSDTPGISVPCARIRPFRASSVVTETTRDPIHSSRDPAFMRNAPPTVPGVPTANSNPASERRNASCTTDDSSTPAPTQKRFASSSKRHVRKSRPARLPRPDKPRRIQQVASAPDGKPRDAGRPRTPRQDA